MSLSDPQRPPGHTPRRAEPRQPDRPGRGTDRLDESEDPSTGRTTKTHRESLDERIQQSDTALDNVRHP